ncbi:MAG: HEPN domain-containing protein [Methanosphaera sp.]|nr:HEPN domain-containing protein [Methanosphaera sp.]
MDEIESLVKIALDNYETSLMVFESGKYRISIALSYYAMFTVGKALLLLKGVQINKHKGLVNKLGSYYVKEGEFNPEIAKKFSRAKTLRENASYAMIDDFDKNTAQEMLELTEDFFNESKKYINPNYFDSL